MIKDQLTQKCTAGPAQLVSSQATLFQKHVRCPTHPIFGILTTELILRCHSQNFPQAQGKLMLNLYNQEVEKVGKTWWSVWSKVNKNSLSVTICSVIHSWTRRILENALRMQNPECILALVLFFWFDALVELTNLNHNAQKIVKSNISI